MTSALKTPDRRSSRWLPAIGIAGGLLLLHATAAPAQQIEQGQQYQAMIAACDTPQEAETLRGFLVSGDLDSAKDYLEADDNTCAVGPVRFVAVMQVGDAKSDPSGNSWKIVEIVVPAAEAYLVTTADLITNQQT